jgi:hypothetical protein
LIARPAVSSWLASRKFGRTRSAHPSTVSCNWLLEQFNEAEALSLGAASCLLADSPAEDARLGALVFKHAGTVAVLYEVAACRDRAAFQTAQYWLGFSARHRLLLLPFDELAE